MDTKIKILVVEHDAFDLQLIQNELRKSKLDYVTQVVSTAEPYRQSLQSFAPHLILSDFSLPQFSGLEAFTIQQEMARDAAFIIVSGTIEEEGSIEMIERGVTDYVSKDKLFTLNSKVKRALNEAQEKLQKKKTQQQLDIIYNTVQDVIFMLEVEAPGIFKFVSVNQAFLNMTGLTREQVVGKYADAIVPLSFAKLSSEKYLKVVQTCTATEWEETSDPGQRTGHVQVTPILDNNGRCTHLVGSVHEITDQKTLIRSLEESNQRNEYVMRATFDAIWDWDIVTRKVDWGEGYISLFGKMDNEETSVDIIENRIHPDDVRSLVFGANEFLRGRETNWHHEHRYRKTNGDYAYVSNNAVVIRNSTGRAVRVIGAMQDITQKKSLETALSTAINFARFGTWELDIIRSTLYWSDMVRSILESPANYEPSLETGLIFYKEGPSRDLITQKVMAASEQGLSFDIEAEIVTAGGTEKWIRVMGTPQLENGSCTKVTGSVQDIDTRKRAELTLNTILEERNTILESIADSFFVVDNNWLLTYWNNHAEKTFNKTREEALGNNLWTLFPESVGSKTFNEYHQSLKTGIVSRFEDFSPLIEKWLAINCYPDRNGGLSVYIKDITASKLDEFQMKELNRQMQIQASELAVYNTELAASEKRFSDIFNLSPQPMWLLDEDTMRFVQVNEATIQLYGYSKDEFMNMDIARIKTGEEAAVLKDEIFHANTSDGVYNHTYRHRKKSGEIIDVEIYSTQLAINGKNLRSVIAIDVTEKNQHAYRIIKAIIKTQEDERYEIGGELHDNICQILAGSLLTLGLLEKSLPPEKLPFYTACRQNIQLALEEIRNLSHRLAPAFFAESTLKDMFNKMLNNFIFGSNTKIKLVFDEALNGEAITLDAQLNLYRILQEQTRNISKYAKASSIEVTVSKNDHELMMTISDNGIGLYAGQLAQGIGMANMKRRAELFSGKFEIHSSPGNGCTVKVTIPLQEIALKAN